MVRAGLHIDAAARGQQNIDAAAGLIEREPDEAFVPRLDLLDEARAHPVALDGCVRHACERLRQHCRVRSPDHAAGLAAPAHRHLGLDHEGRRKSARQIGGGANENAARHPKAARRHHGLGVVFKQNHAAALS